jgi:hypothetical protein
LDRFIYHEDAYLHRANPRWGGASLHPTGLSYSFLKNRCRPRENPSLVAVETAPPKHLPSPPLAHPPHPFHTPTPPHAHHTRKPTHPNHSTAASLPPHSPPRSPPPPLHPIPLRVHRRHPPTHQVATNTPARSPPLLSVIALRFPEPRHHYRPHPSISLRRRPLTPRIIATFPLRRRPQTH